MDRDLAVLADVARFAAEMVAMHERFTLNEVEADDILTSALLHKAIMLGEAANRVSKQGRERWALPWRHMIGLRNVVVHDYDAVDLDVIWRLAEEELPKLLAAIHQILGAPHEIP